MNKYLSAFLKSVCLTGITIGAAALTPYAAIVTPFAALLLKYVSDNWKADI